MKSRRFVSAAFCLATLCLAGCTKKIDGSSMDKYYQSSGEVMKSIVGEERKTEFANGLEQILFFAPDAMDAISELNGKNADDVFEMFEQLKESKPRIDASRREKYTTSLNEVLKSVPNEATRQALKAKITQYGFAQWSNKTEANIRTLDGKNAYEINQTIEDIRRNEDPTKWMK